MRASASIHVVHAIAAAVRARGHDPSPLLASAVDARMLQDPDARVSHATIVGLFESAAVAVGDPLFGLRMGAGMRDGSLHLLEYAIRAGGTLRDALVRCFRFQHLVYDGAPFVLAVDDDEASILHQPPPGLAPPRVVLEYALANVARLARRVTDDRFVPRRVELVGPAPASDAPYRDVFRAPVRFGAPLSAIRFDRAQLDLPVPPGDPTLHAMLERFAEERLERVRTPLAIADEVRLAIRRSFDGAERPHAPAIARRLGMTERTLARRLRDEGHTFAGLLDDVSRVTALELMERGTTIAEVAFFLGFSESSAFHRAFRRWTGSTPGQHVKRPAGP